MRGQCRAAGMGFEFVAFGFDLSLEGGGFGLLLRRRVGEGGVQFSFVESGFQSEQFELVWVEIAEAVGLRGEPRQSVEPALLFEDGDALFLLADVLGELRNQGLDFRPHRLRQRCHQRLDGIG
jgi:hypothetical protein